MKFAFENRRGSVLTLILVVIILIGITLGSYLKLVSNQNQAIVRSQLWNAAIPLAEAGIEEAMAHLNKNLTNRNTDGWTAEGTNVVRERMVGKDKYRVMISKDSDPPVIVSEGFVWMAHKSKFIENARKVRVTTTNDGLFSKAMVAKGTIDLSGNNITSNSFDSSDPKYSTGGMYDPTKTKDNGDIATNSSLTNSLNVGNADIWGKVSTGPGGSIDIGASGAVGDKAWHALKKNGIKDGWSSDDMNVQFPDVKAPFNAGFSPAGGKVNDTNYTYVLSDGNYELSELKISGDEKIIVTGKANLLVKGNVDMTGKSMIYVAPGASLQMFVAGSSAKLGGNGVANPGGKAENFGYWGLTSNTQVSMSGNGGFVGTIYAPHASLVLGGGGNDKEKDDDEGGMLAADFVGSSVTASVKMNGHFNFHYDEALAKFGPRRGYTITSWGERGWTEL